MFRFCAALLVIMLCGCGVEVAEVGPCRPQKVKPFGVGVAHVAGSYSVTKGGEAALLAGAKRTLELGGKTIKLYLTPEYATKYPQGWPQGIHSLATLADSAPFRQVLSLPFDTVIFTTYSFSMGTGDPWRSKDVPALIEADALELEELVTALAARPTPGPRTYIFQTWEGDWALTAQQLAAPKDSARARRMAQWLTRRQAAVRSASEKASAPSLTFATAVEVNRVLDATDSNMRMVTDVLPQTCTDLVSYSAWEATDVGGLAPSAREETVRKNMSQAVSRIRASVSSDVGVYVGELGFAENELAQTGALTATALQAASAADTLGAVYWQIFDNECRGSSCRGLWVLRPDGSLSEAGQALMTELR